MGGAHGHAGRRTATTEDGDEEDDGDGKAGHKSARRKQTARRPSPRPRTSEEADAEAAGERIYAAQVLWDETMADGASRVAPAGDGAGPAVTSSSWPATATATRAPSSGASSGAACKAAVSVRPIIDDGEGNVAALLAAPENDYLFVMIARASGGGRRVPAEL